MSEQRVVVVGQGYVGLPLAMRAVEAGYRVVGFDLDADRVKRLAAGESYVEDVPSEQLSDAIATGRYRATAESRHCAGFDVAVITVPTPLREGIPDLSFIEDSARTLGRFVRPGSTVILESTTYPGTTEELVATILEEASGLTVGEDFHLGYSPERIDPGNPTWRFDNTPKVVSGIDERSLEAVRGFYDALVSQTVPVSSTQVAELAKLLENTFRHVNIALVNELAMFASELGIDVWEAVDAAATKPYGFMKFTPGPGVGGHCLPIDPSSREARGGPLHRGGVAAAGLPRPSAHSGRPRPMSTVSCSEADPTGRLPRLHRAAGRRRLGAHRLGRRPGRDDRPRCPLSDAP